MIDPKTLRIGNWIIGTTDGIGKPNQIQQVFAIEENYINLVYDHQGGGYYIKPEDAYPIPLIDEILLKCGFNIHGMHIEGDISLFKSANDNIYPNLSDYDSPRIQYLHQLQNWVFLLTGKELQIDLK